MCLLPAVIERRYVSDHVPLLSMTALASEFHVVVSNSAAAFRSVK